MWAMPPPDRSPYDVLNVYLAFAGLAGATITRLISEKELKKHRAHLEKLVSERTSELTLTLDRLELEITGHMQAEEELRIIRDHLEELVDTRTAELEKANRELKAYSAKLERINEELKEFAFVASHDLQEPLRKIQTFCDMAKHRCSLAPDRSRTRIPGPDSEFGIANAASSARLAPVLEGGYETGTVQGN